MRRNSILVIALTAIVTLAMSAVASAKWDTYRVGNIVLKADGGVSPNTLPKKRYAPVNVNVKGQISAQDGSHPAAVREVTIDFDRNGIIDTTGLPVCRGGQLEARDTTAANRVCGRSAVGKGSGRIQIAFPEQAPIPVTAPITAFNGGTKRGKTTLYIHTFITVPVPAAVVTTVTLRKVKKGRYGISTVAKVPQIAGGSGSVLNFNIQFGKKYKYKGKQRSYIKARCSDGKFLAKIIKAIFRNEAGGARTVTTINNQTLIRPCRSRG
jgi:hypothetical protein